MDRLTDRDWDKAVTYLDEKAAAIAKANGTSVKPRAPQRAGPSPVEERKAAMQRARELRGEAMT